VGKKVATSTGSSPIFLRYILKSRRTDGESLFSECSIPKDTTKVEVKRNEVIWAILIENGVFPVPKACYSKLAKASLLGFVSSSKGLFQEESNLTRVCTGDGFSPNEYKLMGKSNYDFSIPPSLGHVIKTKAFWTQ